MTDRPSAPTPPPARAAADEWLASLDDVLGPDAGDDLPGRVELLRQSGAAAANAPMRWTADQAERASVSPWLPATSWERALLARPLPPLAHYYLDPDGQVRPTGLAPMPPNGNRPTATWLDETHCWAASDPTDLLVSPPVHDGSDPLSATEAADWIERHALPVRLTGHQRDVLADAVAARAELYGWRRHGQVRLGVDLSSAGGTAVVVVCRETDGGAVELVDALQLPIDGDDLARRIADSEGLDGWAAREEAGRRILDAVLRMFGRLVVPVFVRIRATVDRFVAAIRPLVAAFRRVGAAMARLFRRPGSVPPARRVELARQRRLDSAMRTVARRRARRQRRAGRARR